MNSTLQAAQTYQKAGYSVLPISRDGTKKPPSSLLPGGKWKPFQDRLPTPEELERWFDTDSPPGVAIICGKVSGQLETIDFDLHAETIYPEWCALVDEECPGLLARLSVVKTPKPGYHVRYRCREEKIPGALKLAQEWVPNPERPGEWKRASLVETRGEGGYAIAPGTPAECHESHRLYVHHSGPKVSEAPNITCAQRAVLIRAAEFFDRGSEELKPGYEAGKPPRTQATPTGLRPGEDFDRRGDWAQILTPAGWVLDHMGENGVGYWRRPGKGKSHSATTGFCTGKDGNPLFRVFSSNADPFDVDKAYGKFRCYALLHHGGNLSAAAGELARQGFGDPKVSSEPKASPDPKEPVIYQLPALLRLEIPPIKWVVAGLLCEGLNIIGGKPKLGKSWWALNLGITVAAGGIAFGSMRVEAGDVLYLSLEDRWRRVQDRSRKVLKGLSLDASQRLSIAVEWPRQDRGGLVAIEKWAKSVPNARLVIIDVWAKFRPRMDSRANSYQQDYDHGAELKSLADRLGITILILHHCRKAKAEDVFDEMNSTTGLGGSVDGSMVLSRARNEYEATLAITGRDIEEKELAIEFDPEKAAWKLLGDKATVVGSKTQEAICEVLKRRPWLSPKEIADDCGLERGRVGTECRRMAENGKLRHTGSKYALSESDSVFE